MNLHDKLVIESTKEKNFKDFFWRTYFIEEDFPAYWKEEIEYKISNPKTKTEIMMENGFADVILKAQKITGIDSFEERKISIEKPSIVIECKVLINDLGKAIRQLKRYKKKLKIEKMLLATYDTLSHEESELIKKEKIKIRSFPEPEEYVQYEKKNGKRYFQKE